MPEVAEPVRLVRSAERFRTDGDGVVTRHCFAFGNHYDPDNTGFGDLVAVNDEHVDPGAGYDLHRHRHTEIVTWVLDGDLEHADSAGNEGTVGVDTIQRMSAGSGMQHAERNASGERPVRFIQMWLRPGDDEPPSYEHADIGTLLERPVFVPAVGPRGTAAIGIGTPRATLWIARLGRDDAVDLPPAALRHLHVVRGSVGTADATELDAGDTLRLGDASGSVTAREPTELLVWAMSPSS